MTQQPPSGPPRGGSWQPPSPAPGQQPWQGGPPPRWNAPNAPAPNSQTPQAPWAGQPAAPQAPWAGQPAPQQPMGWTLDGSTNNPRQQPPNTQHPNTQHPNTQHPNTHDQNAPGQYPQQGPNPQWDPRPPAGQDPLGQDTHDAVSIEDYALPKTKSRFWLAGAAVVIVGALTAAAIWTSGRPQPIAVDSPTPSSSQRALPSSVPSGNAVAFASQTDDSEGYWQIQKSEWTDRGLELMIKVTVTRGSFGYSFFCLDNATTDDYDPADISDSNVLRPGTLDEGESAQGLVVFEKDRGDTMVYLANRFGRQVSALAIAG